MKPLYFILLFLPNLASLAQITPENIDITFSENGYETIGFTDQNEMFLDVDLYPDNRILASGFSIIDGTGYALFVRYNQDGTYDPTFGVEGIVKTSIPPVFSRIYATAIDDLQRINFIGKFYDGVADQGVVGRLKTNGEFDTEFGEEGLLLVKYMGTNIVFNSMVIQPDQKIVFSGNYVMDGESVCVFFRINEDGTLDETFGISGFTIVNIPNLNIKNIDLQPDGKILATGTIFNLSNHDIAVVRLNTDGTLDDTYGIDGIVEFDFGSTDDEGVKIIALEDTSAVLFSNVHLDPYFGQLTQLDKFGNLVITFGDGGSASVPELDINDAVKDDLGNYYLVGQIGGLFDGFYSIIKITSSGELATDFSTDGISYPDYGDANTANSIILQDDGKIIVVGTLGLFYPDCLISRYNSTNKTNITNTIAFEEIYLHPNPVIGNVQFYTSTHIQNICIINVLGAQITTPKWVVNDNNYTITIPEDLSNGNYYLLLNNNIAVPFIK